MSNREFDLGAARNMAPPQQNEPQHSQQQNEGGSRFPQAANRGNNFGGKGNQKNHNQQQMKSSNNNNNNMNKNFEDQTQNPLATDKSFLLPEKVKKFITKFYNAMVNNRIADVRYHYYKEWTSLTAMYFSDGEWPEADEIRELCEDNEVFLLCYKELYFRHIFVHGSPQISHRVASWDNYRALFDTFLDGAATSNLRLPLEWLNDMIDEFLYHFQDFCQYRSKLEELDELDIQYLMENPNVWQVQTVLGYLTSFVERSGINTLLSEDKAKVSGVAATRLPVLQGLGYFSLVGLCRLHCLLADYRFSVKVLDTIDIDDKRGLFTRVTASHITLFYYLGFSYFMMRRYADAIDVWSMILIAHRATKERTSSFADDQIMNKYEKILGLTAIATSLCPGQRLDEVVRLLLHKKYNDKLHLMNQQDESIYEQIFNYACPKFIDPATPNYAERVNRNQEAYFKQFKWLKYEVRQQKSLPTIRSFLKLYKSIHIEKLANFCELDVDTFRESLLSMKYQAHQLCHQQETSPLAGKRTSVNDVHFYVVGDIVFVDESKRPRSSARHFMDYALKFQQAIDELNENKPTGAIRVLGNQGDMN